MESQFTFRLFGVSVHIHSVFASWDHQWQVGEGADQVSRIFVQLGLLPDDCVDGLGKCRFWCGIFAFWYDFRLSWNEESDSTEYVVLLIEFLEGNVDLDLISVVDASVVHFAKGKREDFRFLILSYQFLTISLYTGQEIDAFESAIGLRRHSNSN